MGRLAFNGFCRKALGRNSRKNCDNMRSREKERVREGKRERKRERERVKSLYNFKYKIYTKKILRNNSL